MAWPTLVIRDQSRIQLFGLSPKWNGEWQLVLPHVLKAPTAFSLPFTALTPDSNPPSRHKRACPRTRAKPVPSTAPPASRACPLPQVPRGLWARVVFLDQLNAAAPGPPNTAHLRTLPTPQSCAPRLPRRPGRSACNGPNKTVGTRFFSLHSTGAPQVGQSTVNGWLMAGLLSKSGKSGAGGQSAHAARPGRRH